MKRKKSIQFILGVVFLELVIMGLLAKFFEAKIGMSDRLLFMIMGLIIANRILSFWEVE